VTNLDDLYAALVAFILTCGWTQQHSGVDPTAGGSYSCFHSTGESAAENLYIGVHEYYNDDNHCGLEFNCYTGIDVGKDFIDQPGAFCFECSPNANSYFLPAIRLAKTLSLSYWLFGSKDVIMGFVKVSTYHMPFYLGKFSSYLDSDPYPMIGLGMNHLYGPSLSAYYDFGGTGWARPCPYFAISGWPTYGGKKSAYFIRKHTNDGWLQGMGSNALINYYPIQSGCFGLYEINLLENQPNSRSGGYILSPIVIADVNAEIRGSLKYIYSVSTYGLAPAQQIEVWGDFYRAFPDHRPVVYNGGVAVKEP